MQHELGIKLQEEFKDLVFEPVEHTYHVGERKYRSVSSVVGLFHSHFDSENVAIGYAKKHGYSKEQCLAAWEGEATIAANRGTIVHSFGEEYAKWRYFGEGVEPFPSCKQCLGIVQMFNQLPDFLIPIVFELRMFSEEMSYCGTCDWLALDTRDGSLWLLDFKTNKSLFSEYDNGRMKYLTTYLKDENMSHYEVQLNLYALLLEEKGYWISNKVIIHLREQEDKKLYKTYRCKDLTSEIKSLLPSVLK